MDASVTSAPSNEPPSSRATVLLVDDESRMRTVQRRILEKAGYAILEASGASDALAQIESGVSPDLVVADLEMPGISGDEMVRRIRRMRAHQKVIFVTGNVDRLLELRAFGGGQDLFLDKPFTSKALVDAVALALNAGRGSVLDDLIDPPRSGRVLVVDDAPINIELIRRLLAGESFDIDGALDAEAGLQAVLTNPPDVILLDVRMPGRSGFDLCSQLKSTDATRLIPVILMTGASGEDDRLRAIRAGADDFIPKPLNATELRARVRALARMKRYTDELDSAEQVIVSLAMTIEARDSMTNGHCQRLAVYATAFGEALQLGPDDLNALKRGGYLHDLGKIAIPDSVLSKQGPLTPDEVQIMRTHPVVGERLCGELRSLARVRPIVRHHHERLDGSGYPDGLGGSDIPLLAEIMSLVDVYDALTNNRPYRAALGFDDVAEALRREAANGWRRREFVEMFLSLAASGSLVQPHA